MNDAVHLADREATTLAAISDRCEKLIASISKKHDPECFHLLTAKQVRLLGRAYEMMLVIKSGGPFVNEALQDRLALSGFEMPRGDSALTAVQFVLLPSTPYEDAIAEHLACVLRECWDGRVKPMDFNKSVWRDVRLCVQKVQQMRDENAA